MKVVIRQINEVTYHFPDGTPLNQALEDSRLGRATPSLINHVSMYHDHQVVVTTDTVRRFFFRWDRKQGKFCWQERE